MSITDNSSFSPEIIDTLITYKYQTDRLTGDQLSLPYDYNSTKIKANDFVVSDTVNYTFEKLYENWLYLISYSVIPSNNIPNTDYYNSIIIDQGSGLTWNDSTTFPNVSGFTTGNLLSGVKRITKIENIANPNNFNIIASTTTNLMLLSGTGTTSIDLVLNDNDPTVPIYSNSNITHPSNEIYFQNIIDHLITDQRDLFVLDGDLKTIFKFDISGILTIDQSILLNDTPGRLMTGLIGGSGNATDKTKFRNPVAIETVDNLIYVLDFSSENPRSLDDSYIKIFDSELNWKASANIQTHANDGPLDMKFNSDNQRFYILTHESSFSQNASDNLPFLVEYDIEFNFLEKYPLIDLSRHSAEINKEQFKKIYFSNENKNIFYVVTDKNIYKKYISRPTDFIGVFLLDEKNIGTGGASDRNFEDITITDHLLTQGNETIKKDEILLVESKTEVIHRFLEDSGYESSLETQFDNKALFLKDLIINPSEYVSTLVYNKTFAKHLYNNLLLLENTSRKFSTKFDISGISRYIGFTYLNEDELRALEYKITQNNYIGNNELLITTTVNRCIDEIIKLQSTILNNMQEKPINVFPLIENPVQLLPCDELAYNAFVRETEPDYDADRLSNRFERGIGTDPGYADTDRDNLSDGEEVLVLGTDPLDKDSDNDGVQDDVDNFPMDPDQS